MSQDDEDIDYSERTLVETPPRVAKLIHGITSHPGVWIQLSEKGMRAEHLDEGRDLMNACLVLPKVTKELEQSADTGEQRHAMAVLDEWDEPNFRAFRATLRRHHPSVAEYLFEALRASTGLRAVLGIQRFLNRVTALETGSDPSRKHTIAEDKQAVEHLASRGLTKKERERLAKLLEVALGKGREAPLPVDTSESDQARATQLMELRSWYDEWSSFALAHVRKRSHLVALGLAEPKRRKSSDADD